jgi:hypothetical protein
LPDTPELAKAVPETVKDTDPDLGAFESKEDILGDVNEMIPARMGLEVFKALETMARKD